MDRESSPGLAPSPPYYLIPNSLLARLGHSFGFGPNLQALFHPSDSILGVSSAITKCGQKEASMPGSFCPKVAGATHHPKNAPCTQPSLSPQTSSSLVTMVTRQATPATYKGLSMSPGPRPRPAQGYRTCRKTFEVGAGLQS